MKRIMTQVIRVLSDPSRKAHDLVVRIREMFYVVDVFSRKVRRNLRILLRNISSFENWNSKKILSLLSSQSPSKQSVRKIYKIDKSIKPKKNFYCFNVVSCRVHQWLNRKKKASQENRFLWKFTMTFLWFYRSRLDWWACDGRAFFRQSLPHCNLKASVNPDIFNQNERITDRRNVAYSNGRKVFRAIRFSRENPT